MPLNAIFTKVVVFTLGVIGFGAAGPIENKTASKIQKAVYGAAVPAGSLFASLQRLAMKMGQATT
ncbi:hypothetical protein H2198_006430 [Neophaeococcomyces mojaviensis]|uniref:Uncharacterized protein n=1 Tax=Neophaeococcomyces mojaviensis TaxID=3383035 RepID=A0ACC3A3E7_9EURO|nr:hypothetical protein H2198_006430 [Knufia sp. JES_112]